MNEDEVRAALVIAASRRRAAVRVEHWQRAYELAMWMDRLFDMARRKPRLTRDELRGGTEDLA